MTTPTTDKIWPPAATAFPMIGTPQIIGVYDHEQAWMSPPDGVTDATVSAIDSLLGRGYVLVDIGTADNHGMFDMTNGLRYFNNE